VTFFSWAETPPREWVDDLARISPPLDRLAHLELWWEAGFPWSPVQRWVTYQLTPLSTMPYLAQLDYAELMDLEHPCRCSSIWTAGGMCSTCLEPWPCSCGSHTDAEAMRCGRCKRVRSQGRTNLMDAFRRGYRAAPLWVLQGEHGGHKFRYTNDERMVAKELGMAETPPEPGSLPFARWDYRVRDNLLRYDMAQRRYASLKRARAHERDALARAARATTQAYLTGAIDRVMEDTAITFADDLPRTDRATVDESAVTARYIETGRMSLT
jgi:hypothetical protein